MGLGSERPASEVLVEFAEEALSGPMVDEVWNVDARTELAQLTDTVGIRPTILPVLGRVFAAIGEGKEEPNKSYISDLLGSHLKYNLGLGCQPSTALPSPTEVDVLTEAEEKDEGIPSWVWGVGGVAALILMTRK